MENNENNNIVEEVKEAFAKFNSKLHVNKIFDAGDGVYFVVAQFSPDKNVIEEDPFYFYANGKVTNTTITDSAARLKEFGRITQDKNLVYSR